MKKNKEPDAPDLSALWPLLPPWIEWVAMDREGSYWGYERRPKRNDECEMWVSSGDIIYIPGVLRGDWRMSLVRRPKG